LKVRQLVNNLLDHALELAHLDLEQGQAFLVRDGAVGREAFVSVWFARRESDKEHHDVHSLVVHRIRANINVQFNRTSLLTRFSGSDGYW
jgi:hypothetical protein